jgi:hypothetical protein
MLVLLMLSLLQGLMQIEALSPDIFMKQAAQVVREHTKPTQALLVINGGWGGDLLILADRKGLSVDSTELAEHPDSLAQLKNLGFTHLVAISESPLVHAQQLTNPGSGDRERVFWQSYLSDASRAWTSSYISEDLVIKELP